jgi:hypothetical protein
MMPNESGRAHRFPAWRRTTEQPLALAVADLPGDSVVRSAADAFRRWPWLSSAPPHRDPTR